MFVWLWKIHKTVLVALCYLGILHDSRWAGILVNNCEPWTESDKRFQTIGVVMDHVSGTCPDFGRLLPESYEEGRLKYWWGNVTILAPDPQSEEWKALGLVDEHVEKNCYFQPEKCPREQRFVKHHLVESSLRQDKKYKTVAGDKVWWCEVNGDRYLYPAAVKVLERVEALNGEIWKIERPLWSELRGSE